MILGVGSDLTDIRRIDRALARHGERFETRLFTEIERARARAKRDPAATYAKRFAAKEACAKALGTGIRRGVFWRDMGVVNRRSGAPTLTLTGGALQRLEELTPPGWIADIHLSLADEHPLAQAFVVISAQPADDRNGAGRGAGA
jgi:holo-[acyl-carrier protein] synthase